MALPELPIQGQNPWFEERNNWDLAVELELEGRLSETTLNETIISFVDPAVEAAVNDSAIVRGGEVTPSKASMTWAEFVDHFPADDHFPANDQFPPGTVGAPIEKDIPILDGSGDISVDVLPSTVVTTTGGKIPVSVLPVEVPLLVDGLLSPSVIPPVSDTRPSWASTVGRWDDDRCLYNVTPANMLRTRAARAASLAGDGEWDISILGNSIHQTGGTPGGRSFAPYSVPTRVQRLLGESGLRDGGSGLLMAWSNFETSGTPWRDPRHTFVPGTGSITVITGGIAGEGARTLTGDAYWQVTIPTNVDRFLIVGENSTARSNVIIDPAGANTTLSWASSTADVGADIACLPGFTAGRRVGLISGLTPGPHVIRIVGNTAGITMYGVDGRLGSPRPINSGNPPLTSGFRVHSLARVGVTLAGIAVSGLGVDGAVRLANSQSMLIAAGVNDWQINGRVGYNNALRSLLDAQLPIGDATIVLTPQPDYTAYPPANPGGWYPLPDQMHDAYLIADEYDVPLLDLAHLFVDFPSSSFMYPSPDGIHPTDTGRELMARYEFQALTV